MESRLTVEIDDELKKKTQIFALQNDTTLKHVVTFALEFFFEKNEAKPEEVIDVEII